MYLDLSTHVNLLSTSISLKLLLPVFCDFIFQSRLILSVMPTFVVVFYLLWNFLFLAGSGLKYGVNVYHILKFCQPRTIGNEMVWGLQCEEYSFWTPLKNTKITHFTQHWTTVYARNVPHIMVLRHIMNPGIHEDVSSFCVSNDIIIILHLQWEWH